MEKVFNPDMTYLPLTMQQFESLTNEMLTEANKLCTPSFLEADYMAQIVMSAIHALKHEQGMISKTELLHSCVNRISCHVTYHVVQEIQEKIKAKAKAESTPATPEQNDQMENLIHSVPDVEVQH